MLTIQFAIAGLPLAFLLGMGEIMVFLKFFLNGWWADSDRSQENSSCPLPRILCCVIFVADAGKKHLVNYFPAAVTMAFWSGRDY